MLPRPLPAPSGDKRFSASQRLSQASFLSPCNQNDPTPSPPALFAVQRDSWGLGRNMDSRGSIPSECGRQSHVIGSNMIGRGSIPSECVCQIHVTGSNMESRGSNPSDCVHKSHVPGSNMVGREGHHVEDLVKEISSALVDCKFDFFCRLSLGFF